MPTVAGSALLLVGARMKTGLGGMVGLIRVGRFCLRGKLGLFKFERVPLLPAYPSSCLDLRCVG